jgi:hypothetical protein
MSSPAPKGRASTACRTERSKVIAPARRPPVFLWASEAAFDHRRTVGVLIDVLVEADDDIAVSCHAVIELNDDASGGRASPPDRVDGITHLGHGEHVLDTWRDRHTGLLEQSTCPSPPGTSPSLVRHAPDHHDRDAPAADHQSQLMPPRFAGGVGHRRTECGRRESGSPTVISAGQNAVFAPCS